MSDLMPCPVCGSTTSEADTDGKVWWVTCDWYGCDLHLNAKRWGGYHATRQGAVDEWNGRAGYAV